MRTYIRYLVNLTILNSVDLESSFCLNIGGSFEQQQSLLVHRSSHRWKLVAANRLAATVKHRCNYGVIRVQNIFDKSKMFWFWPNMIWTYTSKDRWKLLAANCWATIVKHRYNYDVLRVQNILDLIKYFGSSPNLFWTYAWKDRWKLVAANRWAATVKHGCGYGVLRVQNVLDLIRIFLVLTQTCFRRIPARIGES